MKFILSQRNRAILKKFASENVLVAFDFDGTLAPIVSDPDGAKIRPDTRKLLQQVTQLYPCVVVSGRSRKDVRQKLSGSSLQGIHREPWDRTLEFVTRHGATSAILDSGSDP